MHINQDVKVYASLLNLGDELTYGLSAERHGWIQVISGELNVNGNTLKAGDGAAVSDEEKLQIRAQADNTEFLLFDLN